MPKGKLKEKTPFKDRFVYENFTPKKGPGWNKGKWCARIPDYPPGWDPLKNGMVPRCSPICKLELETPEEAEHFKQCKFVELVNKYEARSLEKDPFQNAQTLRFRFLMYRRSDLDQRHAKLDRIVNPLEKVEMQEQLDWEHSCLASEVLRYLLDQKLLEKAPFSEIAKDPMVIQWAKYAMLWYSKLPPQSELEQKLIQHLYLQIEKPKPLLPSYFVSAKSFEQFKKLALEHGVGFRGVAKTTKGSLTQTKILLLLAEDWMECLDYYLQSKNGPSYRSAVELAQLALDKGYFPSKGGKLPFNTIEKSLKRMRNQWNGPGAFDLIEEELIRPEKSIGANPLRVRLSFSGLKHIYLL